jgi:DNA-binding NtrC family response regulator
MKGPAKPNDKGGDGGRPLPLPDSAALARRMLVVEDKEPNRTQLQKLLEGWFATAVDAVGDGTQALNALRQQAYSLVLTDLRMPRGDGLRLIEEVQKRRLPVTVIVTTGHGSISDAVEAMRLGAYDFLTKPLDLEHLRLVVGRALRERGLEDEVAALREQFQSRYAFGNILSKSLRMLAVFDLIGSLAQTTTTVLIEGETGTGKEVVARAIHEASKQRTGPMVAVNCAALPETLLESELFGHEKGSFTGAAGQRKGRFELADGGTLFLDEVGDVPASMQAKLLRVLQERRFERVGGTQAIEVDVRVIAATNRSLRQMIEDGRFREDLYYRLNVVKIDLPPLRERREDIPLLATHFARKYARPGEPPKQIPADVMAVLVEYHWPGNIRQLENAIERACVTSRDKAIHLSKLPPEVVSRSPDAPPAVSLDRPMAELAREAADSVERQYIRKALEESEGDLDECANLCGLSRSALRAKLVEHHIDAGESGDGDSA